MRLINYPNHTAPPTKSSKKIMEAFMPKKVETREKIELIDEVKYKGNILIVNFKGDNKKYPVILDTGAFFKTPMMCKFNDAKLKDYIEYRMYLYHKGYYDFYYDDHILQKIKKVVDKMIEGYRNTDALIKELGNGTK